MRRDRLAKRILANGWGFARPRRHDLLWLVVLATALLLNGCASQGKRGADTDEIPPEIARIPDAVPKVEPLAKSGNPESYVVRGQRYFTEKSSRGHVERGLASWYGEPFHGRKTSSGEIYDMHAMSAAHKTLPLPTYARVTNTENGRSVVVRINDRGPFHGPRIIDLSYTAAVKLGVARRGTAMVEVRAIDPRRARSVTGLFLASQEETRVEKPVSARPARVAARSSDPARPTKAAVSAVAVARTPPPRTQPDRSSVAQDTPAAAPRTPVPAAPNIAQRSAPNRANSPLYLQVGAFGDQRNAERLRSRLITEHLNDDIRIVEPELAGAPLYKVRIGPLASEQDADRVSQQLAALGVATLHRVRN